MRFHGEGGRERPPEEGAGRGGAGLMKNSPIQPQHVSGEVSHASKRGLWEAFPAGQEMEKMTLSSRNRKHARKVEPSGNKELRLWAAGSSLPLYPPNHLNLKRP